MLGFEIEDSLAILRLDDLYVDSFQIKDGIPQYLYINSEEPTRGSPFTLYREDLWGERENQICN